MSYDLYCYRSGSGKPNETEADSVIEADTDKWAKKERDPARRLAIVKALTEYNPRLEAFDFHNGEIAKLSVSTIEQEKNKFDHIEINYPEDDVSLRIIIYDNHVLITAPYGARGQKAEQLFDYIKAYVKIIRETAGYFISDPQTGHIYDPAETEYNGLAKYLSV